MKKYLGILCLFLILVIIFNSSSVNAKNPLNGVVIVIDPGHGSLDSGTSYNNIYEKDINLKISKYLERELIKNGAKVILTRTGDYDLSSPNAYFRKKSDFDNRIRIINEENVDLYVSIHLNYLLDARYSGPQVFYDKENDGIADIIQKQMNKDLKGNRDIKRIPDDTYMYSRLDNAGVLIECGFLSNKNERTLLVTDRYQLKVAKSIAKGIKKIF